MPPLFWVGLIVLAILFHSSFLNDLVNRVMVSRRALEDLSRLTQERSKRTAEEMRAWRTDQQHDMNELRARREEMRQFQMEQMERSEELLRLQREQLAVLKKLAAILAPEQAANASTESTTVASRRRSARATPDTA